jgi:hypothetical protein
MPGDVEYKDISSPGTLKEWGEKAKKANEETGGFITCKSLAVIPSTATREMLIQVGQVEWVYEIGVEGEQID